jgi:hypothetical protein
MRYQRVLGKKPEAVKPCLEESEQDFLKNPISLGYF